MKSSFLKVLSILLLGTLSLVPNTSFAQRKSSSDVSVKSYVKSNGTVVQGHMRSAPDKTGGNNFSTKGNVNPYTGEAGTVVPDVSYSSNPTNKTSFLSPVVLSVNTTTSLEAKVSYLESKIQILTDAVGSLSKLISSYGKGKPLNEANSRSLKPLELKSNTQIIDLKLVQLTFGSSIEKVKAIVGQPKEIKPGALTSWDFDEFRLCFTDGKLVAYQRRSKALAYGESEFKLAESYRTGVGKIECPPLAFENYMHGALLGNPQSMLRLSWCYQFAYGVDSSLDQAFRWAKAAADTGDNVGIKIFADMTYYGIGCQVNHREAVKLYTLASEQGNVDSIEALGRHYRSGLGVDPNQVRANELDYDACKKGSDKACARIESENFTKMFVDGKKVADAEINPAFVSIFEMIRSIFVKKFSGIREYVWCIYNGFGCKEDKPLADRIIARGIRQRNFEACALAGWITDPDLRFSSLRIANQAGAPNSDSGLGACYLNGFGTPIDVKKAYEHLALGSAKGDSSSLTNLGTMFHNGYASQDINGYVRITTVPVDTSSRNYESAFDYYSRSASLGETSAMCNIGVLYEFGLGRAKNIDQAKKWYSKALQSGNEAAKESLKRLESVKTP